MPIPATSGSFKTDLLSMAIGDYIAFKYASSAGAAGTFSDFGADLATAQANEIPVAGAAAPNGYAYALKVAPGLLICDRVLQHSISYDTLNAAKLIQGKGIVSFPYSPLDFNVSYPFSCATDGNTTTQALFNVASNSQNGYTEEQRSMSFALASQVSDFIMSVTVAYGMDTFDLYTSTNGMNWTSQGSKTITLNSTKEFSISGPAKYVKIANIKSSYSSANLGLSEVSFSKTTTISTSILKARSLTGGVAYLGADGKATTSAPWLGGIISNQAQMIESGHWASAGTPFEGPAGEYRDGWESNTGVWPCYIGQNFGTPKVISKYTIQAPNNFFSDSPYKWNFEASNDGTNWTILDTKDGIVWTALQKREFSISNTTAYQYYRINILKKNSSAADTNCMIGRAEFIAAASGDNLGCFPPVNEFDKYIRGSNLGGKITADDPAVWNHDVVATICQDTPSTIIGASANRIKRTSLSDVISVASSTAETGSGFRPVFEFLETGAKASNLWY